MSERGYGNAIFFAADNGLHFTFGHLQDYRCDVASDLDYFRQALELLGRRRYFESVISIPTGGAFRYQQGDCLARTGESGSGPPHLHFEIWRDGQYVDPLTIPGIEIEDHEAPTLATLYIQRSDGSTISVPLLPMDSGTPVRQRFRLDADLPPLPADEPLRLFVGGFDRMASRNRNGVYSVRLSDNERQLYFRSLDRLLPQDLGRSGEFYDVARTNVGKEYVYNLAMPGAVALRIPAEGQRRLHIELADEAGNIGELNFELKAAGAIPAGSSQGEDVHWTPLPAGRAAGLQASSGGARLNVSSAPGSLFLPGEGLLMPVEQLPEAAKAALHNGALALAGPIFEFRARDLYLRTQLNGLASFPAPPGGRGAIYLYSEAIGRWSPLAAVAHCGAQCNYRFDLPRTGWIAQLEDHSPPRLLPAWLWQAPGELDEPGVLVREYTPLEEGAGFDPRATLALLDGRQLSAEWIADRGALVLRIPRAMIPARGAILSLQAVDLAGNRGDWRLEFLEPAAENN